MAIDTVDTEGYFVDPTWRKVSYDGLAQPKKLSYIDIYTAGQGADLDAEELQENAGAYR